jgi:hypothetical protein
MNPSTSVIHFNCQHCGTLLTVPAEMAGVTGPCPQCRASITSPQFTPPPPPPEPINPFAAIVQHQQAVAAQTAAAQASAAAAGYGPMAARPPAPVELGTAPVQGPVPQTSLPPMPSVAPAPQGQFPLPAGLMPQPAQTPEAPLTLGSLWNQSPTSAPAAATATATATAPSALAAPVGTATEGVRMTGVWPPSPTGVAGAASNSPGNGVFSGNGNGTGNGNGHGSANPLGRSTGAHPVMDRLLQTTPPLTAAAPGMSTGAHAIPAAMPTTTPGYQDRSSAPPKRRMSSSRDTGRRGAMWMAMFMAILVIAGVSWFFRDQLRATWLSYTMKDDEEEVQTDPSMTAPSMGSSASASNPSLPKALPVAEPKVVPPSPPATTEPPSTAETPQQPKEVVLPPLPANGAPSVANGSPSSKLESPNAKASPAAPATGPESASGSGTSAPKPAEKPTPSAPAHGLVEVPGATVPPPVASTPSAPPPAPAILTGITPETKPALEALQKFFHAKTWEERLPFVQAPKSMKPIMEDYYKTVSDGPLYPSHIRLLRHNKAPETGPPQCVFEVAGGGLKQPLPLMVETAEDGWKVDWLTFTEFKDDLLLKFLESPQTEPARFHVLMRRAHYFDDDVPSLDKKMCFQVMPPAPGFTGDVFAIKGSPLSRELEKNIGWDVSQAAAVVELQWRKDERYQWVEMTELVQLNWRNVEPANVARTKEASEPTLPTAVKAEAVE